VPRYAFTSLWGLGIAEDGPPVRVAATQTRRKEAGRGFSHRYLAGWRAFALAGVLQGLTLSPGHSALVASPAQTSEDGIAYLGYTYIRTMTPRRTPG
jgi:hypothetical protein